MARRVRRTVGKRTKTQAKEGRRVVELLLCAALFLAVFLTRDALPEHLAHLREQASGFFSRGVDFRAAFSAVGEMVSGERSVSETFGGLWQEVFGGQEEPYEAAGSFGAYETSRAYASVPLTSSGILARLGVPGETMDLPPDLLEELTAEPDVELPDGDESLPEPPEEAVSAAVIHMEYTGRALPENTTMDYYRLDLAETLNPVSAVQGWWISSDFGWRDHPIQGKELFHNGLDIAVNTGTEVGAFADGTVDYVGESPIYGLYLQISHGEKVTSFYAHCSKLLVKKGQKVKMGETVALSGSTGNSTGPHLHFELRKDGVLLNPAYYI